MAVSENDTSDCNSDSSADGLSKERKERPYTKAVIRRLPPSMTKDTFLSSVSPLPDYDYMYFVKADLSLGEYAFSRAYINFKNSADIFMFKEKFDNYVFLDAKGNEFVAVVEFAPFSRIPKKRNKIRVDPKCASIETDPVYSDFLELLNTSNTGENEEKPEYCFQPSLEEEKQKNINTPLLEYIKQRRIDKQKIREEKREERKRRELERKRFKEEERKRRTRPDNLTFTKSSSSKNVQILNSVKESDEKYKDEKPVKERKYEDTKYRKSVTKEDRKYSYQKPSKDLRKIDDMYKKSPSKTRPRTFEKSDPKKLDPKRREDSYSSSKYSDHKETEEERTVEKKVKKYSERREERKNEIKKLESVKPEDKPKESEIKETKSEMKIDKSDDSDEKNDSDQRSKDNDPRAQRRIRNKDRPSLAIYQPGMGFARQKKAETNADSKSDT